MKLLHTSDWHLGHYLHGHDREFEHRIFLEWLEETCRKHAIDALIVAGDIFDSANPPAKAQAMYYRFLARLRSTCPNMDVVIVGGNHDSAMRLDAPLPLLAALHVQVVGGLAKKPDRSLDFERFCLPLTNQHGEVKAWCVALPYLRPAELPRISEEDGDPLIEGVRAIYQESLDHARSLAEEGQALIATGHCYMANTQLSELSERKVLRGNQHALPADLFPDDIAYVALGHLHRPQSVGSRTALRYSGSPIPLSMAEQHYQHQVVLVTLKDSHLHDTESILIPRTVPLQRIPQEPEPWDQVRTRLQALPDQKGDDDPRYLPFLEVQVLLEKPEPGLRHKVNSVLEPKAIRLVKLTTHYSGSGRTLAESEPQENLQNLQPETVFQRKYEAAFNTEPSEAMQEAFFELLESVQNRSSV